MAIGYIQSNAFSFGTVTLGSPNANCAYSSSVQSTSLLLVGVVAIGGVGDILGVIDSKGNTYTRINACHGTAGATANTEWVSLWAAKGSTSGSNTVTVQGNVNGIATSQIIAICVAEYQMNTTYDQQSQNNNTSSTCTGPALTTTLPAEVLIAWGAGEGGSFAVSGGLTSRQNLSARACFAEQTLTTIGTYTPTFTQTTGYWYGVVAVTYGTLMGWYGSGDTGGAYFETISGRYELTDPMVRMADMLDDGFQGVSGTSAFMGETLPTGGGGTTGGSSFTFSS